MWDSCCHPESLAHRENLTQSLLHTHKMAVGYFLPNAKVLVQSPWPVSRGCFEDRRTHRRGCCLVSSKTPARVHMLWSLSQLEMKGQGWSQLHVVSVTGQGRSVVTPSFLI